MTDLLDPLPDSPGTRRKENTRARLVRASLDVFVDKGIDAATIDDLVKSAGFTRGAFYSNFSTKEEVFDALFVEVTDELIAMVRSSAADAITAPIDLPQEQEAAAICTIFERIRPFGRQWCLLHSDAVVRALRDEALRARVVEQRLRLRDAIAETLRAGYEARAIRPVIPLADLAELLVGVMSDLLVREQLEGIDVGELSATAILRILDAFADDPAAAS